MNKEKIYKNGKTKIERTRKFRELKRKGIQEDKKKDKLYFLKIIDGVYKDENKCRFVKLPDNFYKGEKGQKLQSLSPIAWYLFSEMVFDTRITNGKITENDCKLLKRIYAETERDIGREINLKEFVNAINILISFGYIRRLKDTIEIKNYEQYYI